MVLSSRPFELTLKGGKAPATNIYSFWVGFRATARNSKTETEGTWGVIHPENPDPPLVRKPHIKAEGDFGGHSSVGPRAVRF